LLLVAVAVYAAVVAHADELHRIRFDGLATVLYVANWRAVFATTSYWELFAKPSPLQHTWSLAIEEQFYLVWPLVIAGLVAWCVRTRRAVAPRVLALSAVLAAASLVAMVALYKPGDTNRAYFGTDTRASSILVGAALAALLAWRGHPTSTRGWRWLQLLAVGGVAVLAYEWLRVDGTSATVYRGGFFVAALAAAAIIAAITHPRRGPVSRGLELSPLVGLGIISYGVYLWHWPVYLVLDTPRTHLSGWSLFALRVAVTLGIALASYTLLERPIRRGAFSAPTLRRVTPAIAATVVIALVATTAGFKTPALASAQPQRAADVVDEVASAPPTAKRVMLVGNSVAFLLADGFKALTPDPPLVVLNAAPPACIFPSGVTGVRDENKVITDPHPPDCTTYWTADVARFQPDFVLLVLGDFGDGDWQLNGQWIHPCTPVFDDWYRTELRNAVATLGASGGRVVLTTSAYRYGVAGASRFAKDDCVNDIDRAVAAESPNTLLIDLAAYVCPTRACRTEQDGVVLRSDGMHYQDDGARLVAGWMLAQLR
jgi:peptidoglycan/LPS O-acetylase OafA/YrhL